MSVLQPVPVSQMEEDDCKNPAPTHEASSSETHRGGSVNIIDWGPFKHVEYSHLPTKEDLDSFFMYGDYIQMSPMEEVEKDANR